MSATHSRFGRDAVNARSTRSRVSRRAAAVNVYEELGVRPVASQDVAGAVIVQDRDASCVARTTYDACAP